MLESRALQRLQANESQVTAQQRRQQLARVKSVDTVSHHDRDRLEHLNALVYY